MPTPLFPSRKVHGNNWFYKVVLIGQFYQKCNCWHAIHFMIKQMVMDVLNLIPIKHMVFPRINRLSYQTISISTSPLIKLFKRQWYSNSGPFCVICFSQWIVFVHVICWCNVVSTLILYRRTFIELNNCLSVIWIVVLYVIRIKTFYEIGIYM